eukprot:463785-Amphidinium_carterae.1
MRRVMRQGNGFESWRQLHLHFAGGHQGALKGGGLKGGGAQKGTIAHNRAQSLNAPWSPPFFPPPLRAPQGRP